MISQNTNSEKDADEITYSTICNSEEFQNEYGIKDDTYINALETFQTIPDNVRAQIYIKTLSDCITADGNVNEELFDETFVNYVTQYTQGTFEYASEIQNPSENTTTLGLTISNSQSTDIGSGITKIVLYNWGYKVYLSSTDTSNITNAGTSILSIVEALTGVGIPVAIATAVAGGILSYMVSNNCQNGIVIDIQICYVSILFGHTILIPHPPIITNIYSQ